MSPFRMTRGCTLAASRDTGDSSTDTPAVYVVSQAKRRRRRPYEIFKSQDEPHGKGDGRVVW